MKKEYTIHKTASETYRILVNGKVHPLLCGYVSEAQATGDIAHLVFTEDDEDFVINKPDYSFGVHKKLILYHGDCMDGKTAAAIFLNELLRINVLVRSFVDGDKDTYIFVPRPDNGSAVYITVVFQKAYYNKPTPDVSSYDHVTLLDFCYPPEELVELSKKINISKELADNKHASKIIVVDHHVKMMEKIVKHIEEKDLKDMLGRHTSEKLYFHDGVNRITYHFDIRESGASFVEKRLTHSAVLKETPLKAFIEVARDYDLRQGDLDKIIPIITHFYHFHIKDKLIDFLDHIKLYGESEEYRNITYDSGKALLVQKKEAIYVAINLFKQECTVAGYDNIPVCKGNREQRTEMGAILAKGKPFSVTYEHKEENNIEFSLRSDKEDPNAVNVGDIAVSVGGGGHQNASGFTMTREQSEVFIPGYSFP